MKKTDQKTQRIYLETDPYSNIFTITQPKEEFFEEIVFFRQDIHEVEAIYVLIEKFFKEKFPNKKLNLAKIKILVYEILSNAIISSYTKQNTHKNELLIARWKLINNFYVFQVFDFGGGLDLKIAQKKIPKPGTKHFISDIIKYQNKTTVTILNNGREMSHFGNGQGLKIIMDVCESINLKYFCEEWKISNTISKNTIGTLFSCRFLVDPIFKGDA
jgi:anti-sigma regulatory factor (Ser/Thr protein kinase)